MAAVPPNPQPVVTADWSKPVQPGQVEALRAALFSRSVRKARSR
jgi:hypothetical protein